MSIFSDINNLNDISLVDEFADICGWSEKELISHFRPDIEELAKKRKEDVETTIKELRDFYDGYLFTEEGSRLYNPYSILKALTNMKIDPYWFDSGTPIFLSPTNQEKRSISICYQRTDMHARRTLSRRAPRQQSHTSDVSDRLPHHRYILR